MEERSRQLFWARLIGVGIAALVVGWYITLWVWLPPPVAMDQARAVVEQVVNATQNVSRLQAHLSSGEGVPTPTRVQGEVVVAVASAQVVVSDIGGVLSVELPRAKVVGVTDLKRVSSSGEVGEVEPEIEATARSVLSEIAYRAELPLAVEKSISEQIASEMLPYGYLVDVAFLD